MLNGLVIGMGICFCGSQKRNNELEYYLSALPSICLQTLSCGNSV